MPIKHLFYQKCQLLVKLEKFKECSYHSSQLTPSDSYLNWPHSIWTECAVTGHSHGELRRFTAHDPVRHGCDQSQCTQLMKQSVEIRSDEVRWHEWYEHSVRILQGPSIKDVHMAFFTPSHVHYCQALPPPPCVRPLRMVTPTQWRCQQIRVSMVCTASTRQKLSCF